MKTKFLLPILFLFGLSSNCLSQTKLDSIKNIKESKKNSIILMPPPPILTDKFFDGYDGVYSTIGRIGNTSFGVINPPADTKLYIETSSRVGIMSKVSHSTDYQVGILSSVNRINTKAFSVLLRNSDGVLQDTFAVMGDGKVLATEVKVKASIFPDYVFSDSYELPSIKETQKFIESNGHLKGIPTAKEVEKQGGFDLGEMNIKLLEKIEELTLYLIKQNEELIDLKKRISILENKSN